MRAGSNNLNLLISMQLLVANLFCSENKNLFKIMEEKRFRYIAQWGEIV